MSFSYTTKLQARIALAVWGVINSGLTADQKTQLDATWTSGSLGDGAAYDAYVEVAQLAQWFEQASATPDVSLPEPAWDRLFVAKVGMILTKTVRPDRFQLFKADHDQAMDETVDTFSHTLASAAVSSSSESQKVTMRSIRYYVMNKCIRRKEAGKETGLRRRIFPQADDIDAATQEVLNEVWNKNPWHFRRRQVTLVLTPYSFTTATWTESTLTLTSTASFTGLTVVTGSRVLITGGTGVTTGEYAIASSTANTLVLGSSISTSAVDLTTGDITGATYGVTMRGLNSGETFDSIASRRFYHEQNFVSARMQWADPTEISGLKAWYGTITGCPQRFCTERSGTSIAWHILPYPDTTYTLRGAVYITGPGTPSSETDTTIFAKFPAEFGVLIREYVLAKVLLHYGASDADRFMQRSREAVEGLLPVYASQGSPTSLASMEDVYNDHGNLMGDGGFGGMR